MVGSRVSRRRVEWCRARDWWWRVRRWERRGRVRRRVVRVRPLRREVVNVICFVIFFLGLVLGVWGPVDEVRM